MKLRKLVLWTLVWTLVLSCLPGAVLAAEPEAAAVGTTSADVSGGRFRDVDPDAWYSESVEFAVAQNLMNGVDSDSFAPNAKLTRGMLVTILYCYEGSPAVSGKTAFTDVRAGQYYTDAVKWAADSDIVKGTTATTFQPNTNVTREQLATILYRFAQYKGLNVQGRAALNGFADAGSVGTFARDALGWAVDAGVIQGSGSKLSPKSTATRAEAAAMLQRYIQNVQSAIEGTLTVRSTIFGSGDTGGKTTLKRTLLTASGPGDQRIAYSDPVTGERKYYDPAAVIDQPPVSYTGSAVLMLNIDDVDDSLIDSSKARVRLVDGDGYYADELVLKADTLEGAWHNGQLEYTLEEGDLEWYTGGYVYEDDNSGREWSILGGDGSGCYTFNLEVSGVTYDGKPVNSAVFPVKVYIWGRTGTDLAPAITDLKAVNNLPSGAVQSSQVQWSWVGDQGDFLGARAKPVLCDDKQDDFFITWPAGADASGLTAKDVTVTLHSRYGDSYELLSGGQHAQYAVFSSQGETQVAVTFRHAAFTPVFTTMTIEVDGGGLQASRTYEIASVYAYMVQQGGGGASVDGVCTAYSYYGYEGLSVRNAVQASYTLKYVDGEGKTWYYNEKGGLSEAVETTTQGFTGPMTQLSAPDDARVYDAMGASECDVQFLVNTLFVKTRMGRTEVLTVDGEEITFSKEYATGQIGNWDGVSLAPGYVRTEGFSPNQQWAWSQYYRAGWSPELGIIPTDFPYTSFPFGNYTYTPTSGGPGGPGGPLGPGGPN